MLSTLTEPAAVSPHLSGQPAQDHIDAQMEVFRSFTFEAADFLPNVAEGHKGGELHCHSFKLVVAVRGIADPHSGFVVDFASIDAAVRRLIDQLDRNLLNDVLENPTCENLASWLWNRLGISGLSYLELWDSPTTGCRIIGAQPQPGRLPHVTRPHAHRRPQSGPGPGRAAVGYRNAPVTR
jgi:6-pyruvoyltetrahydropterin/6-carboxytetrahydropterin synthase